MNCSSPITAISLIMTVSNCIPIYKKTKKATRPKFHWEHSCLFSIQKGSQVAPKTLKIVIDKDATSIKPVQFDEEGFKEYYDVTGKRLNALQKGVNIIKTDKKQRK